MRPVEQLQPPYDTSSSPLSQEKRHEMLYLAGVAAVIGARRVLETHNLPLDQLFLEYKKKEGDTPVTITDRLSERAIKRIIRNNFPNATINAEETGIKKGTDNIVFYVDPLDGTSSFARGQVDSTVGMAVYENGHPKIATICHPFEQQLIIAEKGRGAWLYKLDSRLQPTQETPVRLEVTRTPLDKNTFVYLDGLFNPRTISRKLTLMHLLQEKMGAFALRSTGSNIDQQRNVALGRGDVTITDAVGGFWDIAAGGLIIQEAGGKFTDLYGNPVTRQTKIALGSNGFGDNHEILLEILQKCYEGYEGFKLD